MHKPDFNNKIVDKVIIEADPDLEPLMTGFLRNRQYDITTIKAALVQNDFETVARTAHTMKGVGAGYGFDFITEVGDQLEQAAKASQAEPIAVYLRALEKFLEQVEIIYVE